MDCDVPHGCVCSLLTVFEIFGYRAGRQSAQIYTILKLNELLPLENVQQPLRDVLDPDKTVAVLMPAILLYTTWGSHCQILTAAFYSLQHCSSQLLIRKCN